MGLLKLVAGSMSGSDDGRATFAESKTNFTEGIFQIITSELPGSSWRILSYNKKYWEWTPAVIDVYVDTSLANSFSNLQILDVRFCIVISCVLGMGWNSVFAVLFVFVLAVPTAPTGVGRRSVGALGPGSEKAEGS